MFKTSKKINQLFPKLGNLIEDLGQDENDFIENLNFLIFDVEYEGAINALKLISKTYEKAQENNSSIFYTKNHYGSSHYCYLLIGHEDEILIKIQSGIDKLLDLQKQYDKEYKEEMKVAKAREIANLKAKLKRLESSK